MTAPLMTGELAARDHDARSAIDHELDTTLFVDAGAGSGKTTHLVRRLVALVVDEGVSLGSVAAITFTEAAAAELRHRVRAELLRAATDRVDAHERVRARAAAADVDHAAICTLHAFAQRILAEFPLEAGLPAVIEVLDEIRSDLAFDERWRAFLDELYADPAMQPVLLRGFQLRIDEGRLRSLARVLGDNHDRLEGIEWPARALATIDTDALVDRLDAVLRRSDECDDGEDLLLGHLERDVQAFADRLRAAPDELTALGLLAAAKPKLSTRYGRAPNWSGDGCDEVKAALTAAQSAREDLVQAVTADCLAQLGARLANFTRRAAAGRRRDGTLEFHDLLVFARQLLSTDEAVRRTLHDRYRCLLLDEFQDTDPLQIELATLIATDADSLAIAAADGEWADLPVAPGRLFFVGDPKQSIYRFRRADIELFLRARDAFAVEPTVLARNFRSVPSVIDFVNGFFGELFGEGTEGSQPAYAPLVAERSAPPEAGGPSVWLCGGPHDDLAAEELRELEATTVAAAVRRALDEGWPVGVDVGAGADRRPARPDDIAVLLPARTSLPYLEAALRAQGVPYRAETGSLVWSTAEVQELLTILRAIDDPSDEIALVAALRSPAFGCGDDDLLAFRQAGGRWTVGRSFPEALAEDHPVIRAISALRSFHDQRWWLDVASLVELVVRDRGLFELALAQDRPRDTWRRLRYVLDQARAYTETVGGTLRGFLEWAERQRSDTVGIAAPVLPEADDRAVRILTMHGAKGLEFPITVVSGLTTIPGGGRRGVQVLWRTDGEPPHLRLSTGLQTDDFDHHRSAEEQLDRYERLRLFYVALTRARDHLVIATHHKPASAEPRRTYAELVWAWAAEHPSLWQTLDADLTDTVEPRDGDQAPELEGAVLPDRALLPDGAVLPDRDEWRAAREADLAAARPPAIAATAVAEAARADDASADDGVDLVPEEADEGIDPTRPPWAKGRGGTAFGRAVHAVLQTVDLATGADLDAIARAQATAEGVPDREAEVVARARSALESPLVRAAAAGRHWRELYVGVPIDGRVVEGFVDLLVETPQGLVVVDYKTDAVRSDADVERAYHRYRLQGAAYAVALEAHLGLEMAGAVFLFLTPRGARERRIDDLPAAKDEVRAVVSSRGGARGSSAPAAPPATVPPPSDP
jgi:ATP-dependent helicase/nuclease subunit A